MPRALPTALAWQAAGVGVRRRRQAAAASAAGPQQQQQHQQQQQQQVSLHLHADDPSSSGSSGPLAAPSPTHLLAAAALPLALLAAGAGPAAALEVFQEPANALSLPTWMVHTSSVLEWIVAMGLMWRYGEVSGNPRWKGLAWGMLPALGSAMCACTWHFFYNDPDLQFLVALQAFLTVVSNFTCWWAAYRIYTFAQEQEQGAA